MSFFNTTANLSMRTPLPPYTTFTSALSILRNHETIIKFDPEFQSLEILPPPANASNAATKYYKVTDHMEALPRGLWDTSVTFTAEITDIEKGVEWVIRAPLGLVQETWWTIEKAEEGEEGEWVLREEVVIKCSKLLVGTVKGKVEQNWRGIHQKFVDCIPKGEGGA